MSCRPGRRRGLSRAAGTAAIWPRGCDRAAARPTRFREPLASEPPAARRPSVGGRLANPSGQREQARSLASPGSCGGTAVLPAVARDINAFLSGRRATAATIAIGLGAHPRTAGRPSEGPKAASGRPARGAPPMPPTPTRSRTAGAAAIPTPNARSAAGWSHRGAPRSAGNRGELGDARVLDGECEPAAPQAVLRREADARAAADEAGGVGI